MNKYKIISNKKCNHGYSFFECCIECDKNKERFMNPNTGEYYYIGNDKTKKYVCEHDINKIYCPKCKYLCIHLTKKSKCNICKNSGS